MCSSLLPAQPHREPCSGWLGVNLLCRAPLWGALPPSPIPSPPATTTQRQNLSDGQEEQCRGGEPGLLPSQNWGEEERSLDLPSVSTTQDKDTAWPALTAQGNKPPKRGLRNVSWALFWPLVASPCPHTPAKPCCDCWSFYPWMHSPQLRVCTLGVLAASGCGTVLMQLENCS